MRVSNFLYKPTKFLWGGQQKFKKFKGYCFQIFVYPLGAYVGGSVRLIFDNQVRERRGTSPLRSLRYGREPLGSSGSHHPAVGFIHTALPSSQVPPIKWLTFESGWIIHLLRSRRITVLHRYYGVVRPRAPHRYSHSCGSST